MIWLTVAWQGERWWLTWWMEKRRETVTIPSWQAGRNTWRSNHTGPSGGKDWCSSCDLRGRPHPQLPGHTHKKCATFTLLLFHVNNVAAADCCLLYQHNAPVKHRDSYSRVFLYLLRSLVKHLASAGELVWVGCLPSQCGGVGRPCGRLLSGGGFGHLISQTGAAGAGHGRRPAEGTEKLTWGQETNWKKLDIISFAFSCLF